MWLSLWQNTTPPGLSDAGERQPVRSRARADEEHRHLALEDLGEARFDRPVDRAVAIGGPVRGSLARDRIHDGSGAAPAQLSLAKNMGWEP